MSAKANVPSVVRKRSHMSGLSERLGGDGKIQWKTSVTGSRASGDPHWFTQLFAVVLLSVAIQKKFQRGSSSLCIGLICIGLYAFRATKHDNIPLAEGYIPFLGHFIYAMKNWHRLLEAEFDIFLRLGPKQHFALCLPMKQRFVFITDPKIIDICFRTKFADCWKGQTVLDALGPMLGKGIFASDGKIWKKHRKIASRMFTLTSLRDYMFEVFNDTTDTFMDKLEELNGSQGSVDMYNMYNRLTLEAFTEVAFGVPLEVIQSAPKEIAFATAFDRGFQICSKRFLDVSWRIKRLLSVGNEGELKGHLATINCFIGDVVKERKKQINNKSEMAKKFDILSMFLTDDPNISDKELRDVTVNFIIAGRDTTAQLLSWFTYQLCLNPSVEKRVMDEIAEVFPGDDIDEALDYNKIGKLHYLENAFLESLRLYPSVPHLIRFAKVDIPLPDGHIIRKEEGVVIPTYAMGRLEWIWDKPNEFNPDRFEDSTFTPSEYPAFNIPPRLCLGKHVALMEAKIAIVKLLRKYRVQMLPNQEITYIVSATHQMKNGFKVRLLPRQ